jgi:hypothetical protein
MTRVTKLASVCKIFANSELSFDLSLLTKLVKANANVTISNSLEFNAATSYNCKDCLSNFLIKAEDVKQSF